MHLGFSVHSSELNRVTVLLSVHLVQKTGQLLQRLVIRKDGGSFCGFPPWYRFQKLQQRPREG